MKTLFRWINPIVFMVSRTPLHRLFSHQILVLMFTGRRSGRSFAIPVSYMPGAEVDGKQLLCMTDINGVWWRNLLEARYIQIVHKGEKKDASVNVIESTLCKKRDALAGFCRRSRASAIFSGVGMHAGEPIKDELTAAAERHVLIELTLVA